MIPAPINNEETSLGLVLVFSGCRFLDHHIVKQLLIGPDVSKVLFFDLRIPTSQIAGVYYILGSIKSRREVEEAFDKVQPRAVFHTVSPNPFLKNNQLLCSVNVDRTRNILAASQQHNSTRTLVIHPALQLYTIIVAT